MSLMLLALAMADVTGTTHQYKPTETIVAEPAMATIVIRSSYYAGIELFRKVEDADRAEWNDLRQTAYLKAAKKYERSLKTYETDIKMWNSGSDYDKRLLGAKPVKPDQVTLEKMPMSPLELDNYIGIARKPVIAEDASGMRTYIVRVRPGTYYLAGSPNPMGAIGAGACFCMGTVGFTVRAGQLVDAGTVTGSLKDMFALASYSPPVAGGAALPQLSGRIVEPAAMFAAGKMANFLSLSVTRIKPVPGLLGYSRDIPLDAANQPVPAVR